jgi:hypothetical protein
MEAAAMTISKQQMRRAAFMTLTKRDYEPVLVSGPGIVPGARLKATKGPAAGKQIAVRTSQDREIGLLRRPDNKAWRTIPSPKIHEVVVAVPSLTNPDAMIDVFCFDKQLVVEKFDAALKTDGARGLSLKAPVFVALDDAPQPGSGALTGGLGRLAKWRDEFPVDAIPTRSSIGSEDFIAKVDHLKREFADRNGVDVSKVVIEFRIVT